MYNPPPPPPNKSYYIQTISSNHNILAIIDSNGEKLLTIESDGTIVWHQEGKSPEAAQIFVDAIQVGTENLAGIKQGRKEWERQVMKAMLYAAEQEPLTPERLTEVFNKIIMVNKLKGIR